MSIYEAHMDLDTDSQVASESSVEVHEANAMATVGGSCGLTTHKRAPVSKFEI